MSYNSKPLSRTYNKVLLSTGMATLLLLAPNIFAFCSVVKSLHSLGILKLEFLKKNLEGAAKKFDKIVESSPFLKWMNLESKYLKKDLSTSFSKVETLFLFIIAFNIAFSIAYLVMDNLLCLAVIALAIGIYAKNKSSNDPEVRDHVFQKEDNDTEFLSNKNIHETLTKVQETLKGDPTKIRQAESTTLSSCTHNTTLVMVFSQDSKVSK